MHPQDRLFCEIAVQLQLLTRQQATSCMQAQEREAVGQSVATVALALGYMDQQAVDAVLHQQQRVLERRREARDASRMQREVESRAAAGMGPAGHAGHTGIDAATAPTDRPPAPRNPTVSGAAPRRDARDAIESVPAAAALSAEAGPRYSGTFGEVRHSGFSTARRSGFSDARSSAPPSQARAGAPLSSGAADQDDHDDYEAELEAERYATADDDREGVSPSEAPTFGSVNQARASGVSSHTANAWHGDAATDTDDTDDTQGLQERFGLPRPRLHDDGIEGRQTVPLERGAASTPPPAAKLSSKPAAHVAGSAAPPTAAKLSSKPAGPRPDKQGSAAEPRVAAPLSGGRYSSSKPPVQAPGTAPPAPDAKYASSQPPAASAGSSLPPSAAQAPASVPPLPAGRERASSSMPPSAEVAQSARGTLLESSGMEQQRRELTAPQRHATGRPIPSGRDWRNPSRPPPAAEGFEIEMPLRPRHSLAPKPRSSRPPPDERRSSRPPVAIAAPSLDAPQHLDRALELCAQHGASDYHLHSGALPRMRIDGALHQLRADQPASAFEVESVLAEVLGDEERMQLTLDGELCVIHQTESGIRARLSAFVSEHGSHLQLHLLPMDVPAAEQLGLGGVLSVLREKPWGLAICSGPVGSGVTTTLWALAHGLANERARYCVSLESPLELNVQCGVGLFEQREVGRHVESYAAGIAWALAEGADMIVVSDLLAPGAFEASLHAARARCLVLAGMRAGSSFGALRRLLSEAQGDAELLRRSLADGLRLLLQQRLLPRRSAPGSVAAFELVLGNGRLMQHLRRAEMLQLAAALETSHDPELFTLRDALNDLVRSSVISTDAMRAALGVDRSCLEG